jgi:hypothetical protein
MLLTNPSLARIDLASYDIGVREGRALAQSLRNNGKIIEMKLQWNPHVLEQDRQTIAECCAINQSAACTARPCFCYRRCLPSWRYGNAKRSFSCFG